MKEQQRIVVLDTETTGMNKAEGSVAMGHRIIEIGAIELINRRVTGRRYHQYIKADCPIDPEAFAVHGISEEFLADKPIFAHIADDFYEFIQGAQLVIHNAPFDLAFLNQEFAQLATHREPFEHNHTIIDTLALAKQMFPNKRNSLDALCKRFNVDNSERNLHGALVDADLLVQVYLLMTGGQISWLLEEGDGQEPLLFDRTKHIIAGYHLPVQRASDEELKEHRKYLAFLDEKSAGNCLWLLDEHAP